MRAVFLLAVALVFRCTSVVSSPWFPTRCKKMHCVFQETYQVECDIATGEERENACRPLERFENLVRQSGLYPNTFNIIDGLSKPLLFMMEPILIKALRISKTLIQ